MAYADVQVKEGINLIWNNKFEDAEKIFVANKDAQPRYALHYAEVAFLRSFITADENDTAMAVARLKAAKNLAEEHIKTHEKNSSKESANLVLDSRVVLGDSLYMLAVLQLIRDSKFKGALNMRKSWKVFEESLKVVKKDEATYDIELVRCLNFGAGFFFFAMSIIPQKFLKLIELVGFKADRDLGLKYIQDCHASGGIRSPFATIVLLFNNLLLPRGLANPSKYLREADALIKESLQKYPDGSLFHVMGSHCARKQCDVDTGVQCMETAIENCKGLKARPLIYAYELAACYCMRLQWDVAAKHFEPLIEEEKFQVRGLCALQLLCCYYMLGETEKVNSLIVRMPTIAKKNATVDGQVNNQAKRYQSNGGHFAAFELLYIRRDLAKMERIVVDVLDLLENRAKNAQGALTPVVVDPKDKKNFFSKGLGGLSIGKKKDEVDHSADNRASYLLIKGSLLKSQKREDESIACYRELVSMEDAIKEKWYLPYCLYELGEALYQKGDLQGAQQCMKKCNSISGYDWEDPLKIRLRVTIDQLKKGGIMDDIEDDGASNTTTTTTTNSPAPEHGAVAAPTTPH